MKNYLYILVSFERILEYKMNGTKFIKIETPVPDLQRKKNFKWWRHNDFPLIMKTCKNEAFGLSTKSLET